MKIILAYNKYTDCWDSRINFIKLLYESTMVLSLKDLLILDYAHLQCPVATSRYVRL